MPIIRAAGGNVNRGVCVCVCVKTPICLVSNAFLKDVFVKTNGKLLTSCKMLGTDNIIQTFSRTRPAPSEQVIKVICFRQFTAMIISLFEKLPYPLHAYKIVSYLAYDSYSRNHFV